MPISVKAWRAKEAVSEYVACQEWMMYWMNVYYGQELMPQT